MTKAVSEAFVTLAAPVAVASCEADGLLDVLLESPLVVSATAEVVLTAESVFDEVELDPTLIEPGRSGSMLVDSLEEGAELVPDPLVVDVPEELGAALLEELVLLGEDGDEEPDEVEELELLGSSVLSFAPMPTEH